jgi:hypothetical protein
VEDYVILHINTVVYLYLGSYSISFEIYEIDEKLQMKNVQTLSIQIS